MTRPNRTRRMTLRSRRELTIRWRSSRDATGVTDRLNDQLTCFCFPPKQEETDFSDGLAY